MRIFITASILICLNINLLGQSKQDVLKQIQTNYDLGLKYKNGIDTAIDYSKAVYYFDRAANLGDPQSIYAMAYMKYKGLGCEQDYKKAASLFQQGAYQGRENSMYFYGLCLRNGYGIDKNKDSATFWLTQSANMGYMQARMELSQEMPENSKDDAKDLVKRIHNAAIPESSPLNKFKKINSRIQSAIQLDGEYSGYIIQYDWSGENVISARQLKIQLSSHNEQLFGKWSEDSVGQISLNGNFKSGIITFSNSKYDRKDHYSPETGIPYELKSSNLNLVSIPDTVFMAGNVEMFSSVRKEPAKPIFIALARKIEKNISKNISLRPYPNPFHDQLAIELNLIKEERVAITIQNINGRIVYSNTSELLQPGSYSLPVNLSKLAAGTYMISMIHNGRSLTSKVVKN